MHNKILIFEIIIKRINQDQLGSPYYSASISSALASSI